MQSIADLAYQMEWTDANTPNYRGPQPTALGYKLLALYASIKRATKRATCYVLDHDYEAEDWPGDEYSFDRVAWQCKRCGVGGIAN